MILFNNSSAEKDCEGKELGMARSGDLCGQAQHDEGAKVVGPLQEGVELHKTHLAFLLSTKFPPENLVSEGPVALAFLAGRIRKWSLRFCLQWILSVEPRCFPGLPSAPLHSRLASARAERPERPALFSFQLVL